VDLGRDTRTSTQPRRLRLVRRKDPSWITFPTDWSSTADLGQDVGERARGQGHFQGSRRVDRHCQGQAEVEIADSLHLKPSFFLIAEGHLESESE